MFYSFKQRIKLKKENSKDSIKGKIIYFIIFIEWIPWWILLKTNEICNKDLTYSPISKSQQEIRSNYDELKTKLSNLEEMKKDSFHKIEPKPNLLERKWFIKIIIHASFINF